MEYINSTKLPQALKDLAHSNICFKAEAQSLLYTTRVGVKVWSIIELRTYEIKQVMCF